MGKYVDTCRQLLKAIDAYIEKADKDIKDILEAEGYAEPEKTVEYIEKIEDDVAAALTDETKYILEQTEKALSLENFADNDWSNIKQDDPITWKLKDIFDKHFNSFILSFTDSYIKNTDKGLNVVQVSNVTTNWVKDWSSKLADIMRLNSHDEIENILINNLKKGSGIPEFIRDLQDSGIRDEHYKARRVAVTEVLCAHSVAQQEAFMQSPAVKEKKWRHTGSYRNEPRKNHEAMNGQIVPVSEPFKLIGKNGSTYYPMYPRDIILPAEERINCHCISQPVVDKKILGMSLEERQTLQQKAIENMNADFENALDNKNKTRAGINEDTIRCDWLKNSCTIEQRKKYFKSDARWALFESGVIKNDADLERLYKISTAGNRQRKVFKTLSELEKDGIITVKSGGLKHSTIGDFTKIKNPLKPPGGKNGGNMKGGGHSQANIEELRKMGIGFEITKTYANGVRVGNVTNHTTKRKRQMSGQSWFPEEWSEDDVLLAGTYVVNNFEFSKEYQNADMIRTGELRMGKYKNVDIGVILEVRIKDEMSFDYVGTIFPDEKQKV